MKGAAMAACLIPAIQGRITKILLDRGLALRCSVDAGATMFPACCMHCATTPHLQYRAV